MQNLFDLSSLSPMARGRVETALDKEFRFSDGIMTLRQKLEKEHSAHGLSRSESDGMINYNRRKFNGMDNRQQAAYMARLEAKREYWASRPDGTGWKIPKIIFDVMTCELEKDCAA